MGRNKGKRFFFFTVVRRTKNTGNESKTRNDANYSDCNCSAACKSFENRKRRRIRRRAAVLAVSDGNRAPLVNSCGRTLVCSVRHPFAPPKFVRLFFLRVKNSSDIAANRGRSKNRIQIFSIRHFNSHSSRSGVGFCSLLFVKITCDLSRYPRCGFRATVYNILIYYYKVIVGCRRRRSFYILIFS